MTLPSFPSESYSCTMFSAIPVLDKPIFFLQLRPPKPTSNLVVFSGKFVLVPRVNRVSWKYTVRAFSMRGSGNGLIAASSASDQEALIDGSAHGGARFDVTMNYLSKWLVSAILGALVLLRHDAEAVWFAMGSVLNLLLSLTLKQTLKQERPACALSSGHGMPSSHAQFIFFTAVVIIVSMVEWLGLNAATTILGGLVFAFGSYFSWLRVSLHYHTMSQVGVGAMVGSIFSVFWLWVWNKFVSKAFISSMWVGILVVLGASGSAMAFLLLVLLHCWLNLKD